MANKGNIVRGTYRTIAVLLLAPIIGSTVATADTAVLPSFEARTVLGKTIAVQQTEEFRLYVVCFLGVECPMARIYGPRLSKLAGDYREQGVQVIGINSNAQDDYGEVREYVEDLNISFPIVHDADGRIAAAFSATRTPEVFVLDNEMRVRYHGRIDDQYVPGINRSKPSRHDLAIAIGELVSGRSVAVPETTATGCIIGRRTEHAAREIVDNDITFTQHVMPVLQRNCIECHRDGEIGPFALETYGEVAGWADTMLETIEAARMPPWHANPDHGHFSNTRHMPEQDKQILRDWVAGGLKEGDQKYLPPAMKYVSGWNLNREPDQVIRMRKLPFQIPADGVVEYQYFVTDPGFTEDMWITGAQVLPGNRAVVHHAIVFVRPPDGSRFRGVGLLAGYVPGQRVVKLPPGCARFIPAGSKLVFQMHYTPNGQPQQDITSIGLTFAQDKDVTHEAITLMGIDQEFEIPPRAASHKVSVGLDRLPEQAELLAIAPHMHVRGKAFRVFGSEDDSHILLDVPNYDFNWQHSYMLRKPLPLTDLATLRFEATFDNSESNPFNPDPNEWVTWGDQTWQEMAVCFFEVSEPRIKPDREIANTSKTPRDESERLRKIANYVSEALKAMDRNGDGRILENEVDTVVRHFNFREFDLNGDKVATRAELQKKAEEIYR